MNNIQVGEAARKKLSDRLAESSRNTSRASRSSGKFQKRLAATSASLTTGQGRGHRAVPRRCIRRTGSAEANANQALAPSESCHILCSECEFCSFCYWRLPCYAAEFRVGAGLTDHQVFQRGRAEHRPTSRSAVRPMGSPENRSKLVSSPVRKPSKAGPGNRSPPSTATLGPAPLPGVPMGGPYTIEFRSSGATPVVIKDVLVGDLWILAGQSNMEGVGDLENVQPPDPRVHSFDQLDRWLSARSPCTIWSEPSIASTGAAIPRFGSPDRSSKPITRNAKKGRRSWAAVSPSRW